MSFSVSVRSLLFSTVIALGASSALAASADDVALRSYVLTMDKVNRYVTAALALEKAKEADPSLEQEEEAAENEPSETLSDMRALVAKHPRLYRFFQQQGLTIDDSLLIPLTVVNATIAIETGTPLTDTVSQAQINFVRQNREAIEKGFDQLNN
jgi:hypothetical protein